MSDGVARVPVLPRKVAAGVSVFAVVRSGWAIAALIYAVSVVGVVAQFARLGTLNRVFEPLAGIALMIAALVLLTRRPRLATMVVFLVVSGIGDFIWVHGLVSAQPLFLVTGLLLLNRPDAAMVLIGTTGDRPLDAVWWGVGSFAIGAGATGLAEFVLARPFSLGYGPLISLVNYCAVFLGLSIIQRSQSRRVPDFLQLQHETRRMERARTSEQRAVALIHDTVLNDLATVINGPATLDARTAQRMLDDVRTLATTDLLDSHEAKGVVYASDAALRNQMTQLVSDLQWRGLNVDVTGDTGTIARMTPEAVAAAVGALRACLENVLRHSGVKSAEIVISATADFVTWTVTDAGTGFDPDKVGADRLGLKSSVFHRVTSAGGMAKIWSSPGAGTSVLFSLPLLEESPTDG